jgi:acetolactate synthase regulatory subunit
MSANARLAPSPKHGLGDVQLHFHQANPGLPSFYVQRRGFCNLVFTMAAQDLSSAAISLSVTFVIVANSPNLDLHRRQLQKIKIVRTAQIQSLETVHGICISLSEQGGKTQ